MRISRFIWTVAAVLMLGNHPAAGNDPAPAWNADDVTGIWWSEKKASKIEIYAKDGKYYGKLVWVQKDPDKLDIKNHDPKLRTRTVLGSDMFTNFKFNGKDSWEKGFLYDPRDGSVYQGYLKLENKDVLSVNGFINLPLIGRVGGSNKFQRAAPDDASAEASPTVLPPAPPTPTPKK
jgi:uncharacterized protein (DUF2147 family)